MTKKEAENVTSLSDIMDIVGIQIDPKEYENIGIQIYAVRMGWAD